jgi:hypothetical protein
VNPAARYVRTADKTKQQQTKEKKMQLTPTPAAIRESIRYALHKAGVSYRETTAWKLCQLAQASNALQGNGGRAEILAAAAAAQPVRELAEALGAEITANGWPKIEDALGMAMPTLSGRAAELMAELAEEMEKQTGGARLETLERRADELERRADEVAAASAASAEKLAEIAAAVAASPRAARAARAAVSGSSSPMLAAVERYYPAGADNGGIVVCMSSPAGAGKTSAVAELAGAYGAFFSHGCSNDIDEITNLLGGATPDGAGGFIVTDGPLTAAFRSAAAGVPTLLFLDEIFRLQEAAQKYLLTVLEPCKKSGKFTLRTRRAGAAGAFEVLEATPAKLHIIAAGNLATLEPEEAFWRRFEHKRMPFCEKETAEIAMRIGAKYGHEIPRAAAEIWALAVKGTRAACKAGTLRYPLTNATLARAACVAADLAEIGKLISDGIVSGCAVWDSELGETTAHSEAVCVAIADSFHEKWDAAVRSAAATAAAV